MLLIIPWILGMLTGWSKLAKRYPLKSELPTANRFLSKSIPNLTLRKCVTVVIDDNGLYLEPFLLFRTGFRPVFIPWTDIKAEDAKLMMVQTTLLRFKDLPRPQIQFYKTDADAFKKAAAKRWPASLS